MNRAYSILQKTAIAMITLLVAAGSFSSSQDEAIAERIKAVGTVCVEGQDCANSVAAAGSSGGPKSAQEVYDSGCAACHTAGVAGAPKFQEAADWSDRLAAGLDTVYANAINGKGGMPARGLCPTCSDDEIKAAVDLMIEGI